MSPYYFDYNATTPLAPEVLKEIEPYLTRHFGNPSSFYQLGRVTHRALRDARRRVASLLGTPDETEIVFTSGGTESNNAAIRSALFLSGPKRQVITSAVEHSSVRNLARQLQKEGYQITEIGVDGQGCLNLEELKEAVSDQTAVVSLMMANNETGVVFPIEEVGKITKEKGIFFHVDAVQAAGKIPLHLKDSAIDFLSLSAHKFYGPKGIGALYVRKGTPFSPLIFGGSQERGRRAGTENVPGIVGLGVASELAEKKLPEETVRLRRWQAEFESAIRSRLSGVTVSGELAERLPNTSHLRFEGIEAETLLIALDQKGIYASSGSACMSGSRQPSHVLKAMGCTDDEASSAVRFSFGRHTTDQEIQFLVDELSRLVTRLGSSGQPHSHSFENLPKELTF